ncbi:Phosphonate ABC transporter, periplasmic phosphonate-binding protein [Pseudodesulfovibrio profundus]|uniref:Phosphonate ABC transporter, periplasmic phosphonate-binding protein n=2 Tax=Pseudodesulfovibrio profundus TaxID=57320 RepID=A0A2C8FCP4_9BACT|nr:Phosphonate ABC transporter, periplasmic phosphonate-binding protein [Pseudodesulfovibrio profundus]
MMKQLMRTLVLLSLFFCTLATPGRAETPLKLGVISLNHPLMMYRQYLPFTDYISQESGIGVELILAKDYETIIDDLLTGEIDLALLGGLSYIEARAASESITPLCAILSEDGTPTNRTVIFTYKGSGVKSLADLVGKRFAFASIHSTSGYLHPLCYMGNNGVSSVSFGKKDNLRTHESVVRSVLRGSHDAGAVSVSTYHRFAAEGLTVLAETPPHPGFVIVARKTDLPAIQNLKHFLLSLDFSSPDLQERSAKWSSLLRNGFTSVADQDYARVRELLTCAQQYGYGG